jgi:tetratricopeptide (TPR) repeat protein
VRNQLLKSYWSLPVLLLLVFVCVACPTQSFAAAFEKYLLVMPLRADNALAKKHAWFGKAFRVGFAQATLSLKTIVFLKDDELESLQKEYKIGKQEPDPGQMETLADEKDIAVMYGSYKMKGKQIVLYCNIIPGRNFEARSFKISGTRNDLKKMYASIFEKTSDILNLEVSGEENKAMKNIPGTSLYGAYKIYISALNILRPNPGSETLCRKAIPLLDQAIKSDPKFVLARATRANCRINIAQIQKNKLRATNLRLAKKDIDSAFKLEPNQPLLMNVRVEYDLTQKKYAEAKAVALKNLDLHPANYRNYLLLGYVYRFLKDSEASEKILLKGLDQQGTELQKKPFHRELGLLLLKRNDKHAEVYLHEVLKIETKNTRLYFLRATALYRLKRYMDVMNEIQKLEAIKKSWRDVKVLKSKTSFALGQTFFEEGDFDRAYSYTSIALNIQPKKFDILLLMAKTLRKKGFGTEARKQLDKALAAARRKHPKDHLWLGTEFVAQGYREEGAKEYVKYLKLKPKAPERRRLISLIRKLQGEIDE